MQFNLTQTFNDTYATIVPYKELARETLAPYKEQASEWMGHGMSIIRSNVYLAGSYAFVVSAAALPISMFVARKIDDIIGKKLSDVKAAVICISSLIATQALLVSFVVYHSQLPLTLPMTFAISTIGSIVAFVLYPNKKPKI